MDDEGDVVTWSDRQHLTFDPHLQPPGGQQGAAVLLGALLLV